MMEKSEKLFGLPSPSNVLTIGVEFGKSELITNVAELYVRELARMATVKMEVPSTEELSQYICTLVRLRVENCTSAKPDSKSSFLKKVINIPAFVGTILVQVGLAIDREFGLRFEPKTAFDPDDIMSVEQMLEMSNQLSLFEPLGLQLVQGIPRDPKGELGFMACRYFDGQSVMSYRRDHPVMGFYAAFFNAKWASEIMDGACRIRYDFYDSYKHALTQLVEV